MRIYHGSARIIEFPSIRVKSHTKDFSWGFYCTNNLKAIRLWAEKNGRTPIINTYDYQEDCNLNILYFEKMTDEWLDFIAKCRSGFVHYYDVVEGPMLDDTIRKDIEQYFSGRISRDMLWEQVQLKQPIHQISFHTIRALRYLKYIGSEQLY